MAAALAARKPRRESVFMVVSSGHPVPFIKADGTPQASARARLEETELRRAFVQSRRTADVDRLGRDVMTGGTVGVPSFTACRRQKGRETCADERAHLGIGLSTVLSSGTVGARNDRRVHHVGDMPRVIHTGIHAHACRVRGGHRRHHGDREYGKHGDDTFDHAAKIGITHENVQCRRRLTAGTTWD